MSMAWFARMEALNTSGTFAHSDARVAMEQCTVTLFQDAPSEFRRPRIPNAT
jgi:hypothetical protein